MTCNQGEGVTHFKGCDCHEAARDARIAELEAAITKTLNENGHLADGDNCTLIELKRVMGDRS